MWQLSYPTQLPARARLLESQQHRIPCDCHIPGHKTHSVKFRAQNGKEKSEVSSHLLPNNCGAHTAYVIATAV